MDLVGRTSRGSAGDVHGCLSKRMRMFGSFPAGDGGDGHPRAADQIAGLEGNRMCSILTKP
jgi:hypothetical protein